MLIISKFALWLFWNFAVAAISRKKGAMSPEVIPSFRDKLKLIMQQLIKYDHMAPQDENMMFVATELLKNHSSGL